MNTDIKDTEIRVIGGEPQPPTGGGRWRRWWWLAAALVLAVVAGIVLRPRHNVPSAEAADTVPTPTVDDSWLMAEVDTTQGGVVHKTAGIDTTLLHIYIPLMSTAELTVGALDTTDPDILLAVQAADLRRDNGRIVGAFVLAGEPLSWGLSKRGYCAIIDGQLTLGVADNSPLFEQATEQGGDFFRQYPAVDRGQAVENNPENSARRRALCTLEGRTCLILSDDRMTMNAFAQTLETLGVSDAIFLVGGNAYGWVRTGDGTLQHLGSPTPNHKKFTNYILFRRR